MVDAVYTVAVQWKCIMLMHTFSSRGSIKFETLPKFC